MRVFLKMTILPLLTVLSGCSLLPERPPLPALHDFGPMSRSGESPANVGSTIRVSAPEWLMDDQIHYRFVFDDPTRVRYYNLDRWLAPPPSLLEQRLESEISVPDRLHVRLLGFEQVFDTPSRARAVMRLRARLMGKGNDAAVREKSFQLGRPCPTPDAKGAVAAFSALVLDVERMLQAWLEEPPITPSERARVGVRAKSAPDRLHGD